MSLSLLLQQLRRLLAKTVKNISLCFLGHERRKTRSLWVDKKNFYSLGIFKFAFVPCAYLSDFEVQNILLRVFF